MLMLMGGFTASLEHRQCTPRFMVSHRGHNCISSALTILDSALIS